MSQQQQQKQKLDDEDDGLRATPDVKVKGEEGGGEGDVHACLISNLDRTTTSFRTNKKSKR